MLKGFKDFIMKGDIVDLAIAVVIGTAFAAVVAAFVDAVVTPIVNSFPGASADGWGFSLRGGDLQSSTFVNLSAIINALIVFVITAAVVYYVFVVPLQRLQRAQTLRTKGEPEPEAVPENVRLLREIRDSLNARPAGEPYDPTSYDPTSYDPR